LFATCAAAQTIYVPPTKVNIVDYGAICDNDSAHAAINSAAIQAAIDALNPLLGGIVEFPGNGSQCHYTDPVPNWNGHLHIGFKGASVKGTSPGSGTALFYIGTGPRMLDLRESGGFLLDGITMWAMNPSFAGIIVDGGSPKPIGQRYNITSYIKIVNSNLIGRPGSTCLNVDFNMMTEVSSSTIGGCQTGIRGAWLGPSGSEPYGDVNISLTTSDVLFFGIQGDAIKGCGSGWTIGKGTVFEQQWNTGLPAGHVTSAAQPCEGIVYSGLWAGDVTNATGYWINLYCKGASISGSRFGNVGVNMAGCDGWTAGGNTFDGLSSIVCSASSANGVVQPNSYQHGTPPPAAPCPVSGSSPVDNTPWTSYTPTATSGTTLGPNVPFGSYTASGRYKQIGKTVFWEALVTITSAGSATGWVDVAPPIAPAPYWSSSIFYEGGVSSKSGACVLIPPSIFPQGNNHFLCRDAAGGSVIQNNARLAISGQYEAP
jgi:hypothetical protein